MPSWVKDEEKWAKAKEVAKKEYPGAEDDKFWSIVTGIYKQMGGHIAKAFVFLKSHPMMFPGPGSDAQAKAGNYLKRKVRWNGLTISIENEAGTERRGRSHDGKEWYVRMFYPYGYIKLTTGVDGDHVDCFLGPNMDAPMVYVVHQRKYGDWENYDEDKAMLGFDSEDDARAAYLANYNDPRFLGPITAMPVAEFVEKAKATKEAPAMIKAVLFLKSYVAPYQRGGKMVSGYSDRRVKRPATDDRQLVLFPAREPAKHAPVRDANGYAECHSCRYPYKGDACGNPACEANPSVTEAQKKAWREEKEKRAAEEAERERIRRIQANPYGESKKFYVTVIREAGTKAQQVGWLAGPFDTHEEALSRVDAARKLAQEIDGRTHFDAFGTTARTAQKHPPGVLNSRLGMS